MYTLYNESATLPELFSVPSLMVKILNAGDAAIASMALFRFAEPAVTECLREFVSELLSVLEHPQNNVLIIAAARTNLPVVFIVVILRVDIKFGFLPYKDTTAKKY
jgi:hypothetical protein